MCVMTVQMLRENKHAHRMLADSHQRSWCIAGAVAVRPAALDRPARGLGNVRGHKVGKAAAPFAAARYHGILLVVTGQGWGRIGASGHLVIWSLEVELNSIDPTEMTK
jgi:hypothetical protein